MPNVTIIYWRDIPAQIIVGSGRRAVKRPLNERFETTIDRCAMRANVRDTDSYLSYWRKASPYPVDGNAAEIAESEAKRIEEIYDKEKLQYLVDNKGWE